MATGLGIPVGPAGVADAPNEFEDRLVILDVPGLRKLRVMVPERHDLVLMKTLRGYENDLEAAVEIHARHGLDFETLMGRYIGEMDHVTGDRRVHDLNLLALVERLFDDRTLGIAERRIAAHRGRRA